MISVPSAVRRLIATTLRDGRGRRAMDTTTSTSRNKSIVLALACSAQFMVVLDIAIVNVALPSIEQDLDVSRSTLQWVVIAYGLLLGGFLLLGGRMADLLGRRRTLL